MGTTHELFVSLSLGTTGIALTSVLLVTFYGVFEDYSYDVTLEFWGCGYLQMTNELGEKSFFMCAFTPLGARDMRGSLDVAILAAIPRQSVLSVLTPHFAHYMHTTPRVRGQPQTLL